MEKDIKKLLDEQSYVQTEAKPAVADTAPLSFEVNATDKGYEISVDALDLHVMLPKLSFEPSSRHMTSNIKQLTGMLMELIGRTLARNNRAADVKKISTSISRTMIEQMISSQVLKNCAKINGIKGPEKLDLFLEELKPLMKYPKLFSGTLNQVFDAVRDEDLREELGYKLANCSKAKTFLSTVQEAAKHEIDKHDSPKSSAKRILSKLIDPSTPEFLKPYILDEMRYFLRGKPLILEQFQDITDD